MTTKAELEGMLERTRAALENARAERDEERESFTKLASDMAKVRRDRLAARTAADELSRKLHRAEGELRALRIVVSLQLTDGQKYDMLSMAEEGCDMAETW